MWRSIFLALMLCCLGAPAASAQQSSDADLRRAFARPDAVPFPAANAYTAERELLGRTLFFDPRLSSSDQVSCASCHNPSFGWSDGQAVGHGRTAALLRRSPTILNAAWGESFFWDGRAASLEAQALVPIADKDEMAMPLASLPAKLAAIPGYRPLFQAAYPGTGGTGGGDITLDSTLRALATFERSIVSRRSAFDRWVEGDDAALSRAQRRGLDVFAGPARCNLCHTGWNLTDGKFHDIGLPSGDIGRAAVEPRNLLARYAFKTPALSDTARRAPYMHDGSLPTLDAVVRFYENGSQLRPSLSPLMRPLHLSDQQRADLVAFLEALTAPPQEFPAPALPR